MSKYIIKYQDRMDSKSSSKQEAFREIRALSRSSRLFIADVPDGIYCYTSKAERDADATGEKAYALIELQEF